MEVRTFITEHDLRQYSEWILTHPYGNLWQSLEWKRYQESLGRSVKIYITEEAGQIVASAMVIIDRTVLGLSTWECARGPVWTKSGQWSVASDQYLFDFITRIIDDAKKGGCMSLYLSPTTILPTNHYPLTTSPRHIHPLASSVIDLTQSEEQILAAMHQKARYNIKVARKHGLTIAFHHRYDQKALHSLYKLLKGTAERDGFTCLLESHYEAFLKNLEGSFFLMAWHEGRPIAGFLGVRWSNTGFYYYGASSYEHRHLMAPYLLQWEAILYCKKAGCTHYDLLGIAPEGSKKNNPWAGITDFKRKFGGKVISYLPEQMIVLRPIAKKMLEWKRRMAG